MCGIAGIYNFGTNNPVIPASLKKMTDTLRHRGPDGEGFYVSREKTLGFGHRRLSIIDLETGSQPMSNEDQSIWIVHNGEVYNFMELREELEKKGHIFRTKSDTEVILHLYEEKGEDCVNFLRGMFAFAIWDEKNELLFLTRDRLGQKPLVYFNNGSKFLFASEIKAILEDQDVQREVNIEALYDYTSLGYVPSPHTMFKGIHKLPPAHTMIVSKGNIKIERYWDLYYENKLKLREDEYEEQLLEILKQATKLRLVSDVPLGAFLSGGVDSSLIVYMMSQLMDKPVKTFTIGFQEKHFNEQKYAAIVAKHLGTEHHELLVKPDAINLLPKLIWHYNEPFADSSCIPTYYVSKITKDYVTVALNGDGGDESFAGYDRYLGMWLTSYLDRLPLPLYKTILKTIGTLGFLWGSQRTSRMQKLRRALIYYKDPAKRYDNWMACFSDEEENKLYSNFVNNWIEKSKPSRKIQKTFGTANASDILDKTFYVDVFTYLAEELLVKIDIASMANSLESRSPLLDHHLLEFAARIPPQIKMKHFSTKHILKRALSQKVPKEAYSRPKQGFGVPIGDWFRTTWKDFINNTLLNDEKAIHVYFNKSYVKNLVEEHTSGKANHDFKIWALLNFELWYQQFISN